ncbi:MAG: DUF397 domain-containing protein [Actinomadura sp.]
MTPPDLSKVAWRKSSRSGEQGGECVEVAAFRPNRAIGVRDSKNPAGPVLAFTPADWNAFLARIKASAATD